jgi:Tfp pilus assembly protein PilN
VKHTINFYLEELKPKVYFLTLNNTLYAAIATIAIVMLGQLLLSSQLQEQTRKLNVLQQQLTASQNLLTSKQKELIKHNDKATFASQKEQLEKTLDAKQLLWDGVGQRLRANTVNYYLVMDELTKHHDHDIWLSSFGFSEDKAVFSGFALDSSAVTRWMTYLQSSQSFKGREFSKLNIKAHDERVLSFDVATEFEAVNAQDPRALSSNAMAIEAMRAGAANNE